VEGTLERKILKRRRAYEKTHKKENKILEKGGVRK